VDWGKLGADLILECSGKFLTRAKLQPFFDAVRGGLQRQSNAAQAATYIEQRQGSRHRGRRPPTLVLLVVAADKPQPGALLQGCKKVVVSAPVKDPAPVLNIVYGVNHVSQPCCAAAGPACPVPAKCHSCGAALRCCWYCREVLLLR
jgi:hypothetical protein